MMSHINNPQWSAWPWKRWNAPFERAKVLPTFVMNEWTYRMLTLTCAWHAHKTGNWQLWFSSWICGTFNDAFFMAMPFCDNFWQAQACIMLTPRMPLYIVEMYAAILYSSTTAARRFGLPYIPEAALCGLMAHLMYHTYDINGPRYLWWTWHDADPAISVRQLNAPIGSSIWILTYCALHAALNRWVNDASPPSVLAFEKEIAALMENFLRRMTGAWASKALSFGEFAAQNIDKLHDVVFRAPSLAKIAFCGSVCTPLFMMVMGQFQILSLDIVGIPGKRTYRFAVALYLLILARAFKAGIFSKPTSTSRAFQEANITLFKAIVMFYTVQSSIAALGRPEQHVSTGCHQKVGTPGDKIVKDIMGYDREEHIPESEGPHIHSKNDYSFPNPGEDGNYDASGHKIIRGKAHDSVSCEWYTVVGKPVSPERRQAEMTGVFSFATIGSLLYGWALTGPYNY